MMDNAVTEISRDYFTLYGLFVNEADGRQRFVSPICQIVRIHACACIEVPVVRVTTIVLCGRPKVSVGAKIVETAIVVARRERGKTQDDFRHALDRAHRR